VLVSHGHPDHVADLNPLLRARALRDEPVPPLPTYALPGALRAVMALDRPGMLDEAIDLLELSPGAAFEIGPLHVESRLLPHSLPNVAIRLSSDGRSITYTGDAGPTDDLAALASDTDLLLAEATYVDRVPSESIGTLNSVLEVGRQAHRAGARRLLLTHLQPGTDPDASVDAARRTYGEWIGFATGGLIVELP
jgi:ribonuclease BN (tRNA processing enzyme)